MESRLAAAEAWMGVEAALAPLEDRVSVCVVRMAGDSGDMGVLYKYNPDASRPMSNLACAFVALIAHTSLHESRRDPIELQEQWVCVEPSATSQLEPGASIDFDSAITRALANLDPTASSHLASRAGRNQMEDLWSRLFADPRNKPLMKASEIERARLVSDRAFRLEFESADESARRVYLDAEIPNRQVIPQIYDLWAQPVAVETIGRFGAPSEIALALLLIDDAAGQSPDGPIASARSQFLPLESESFDGWSIASGEPGVIAWGAVLTTNTGDRVAVSVSAHDAEEVLDAQLITAAVGAILDAIDQTN